MTDHLSKEKRSWNMSRIRSKDTKPEMIVRSLLHRMGYRFRLHNNRLPGTPDIILKKHKTVIFVNGCYWHRHKGCRQCTTPSENQDYWLSKFERRVQKDRKDIKDLKKLGWKVVVIWECETKSHEKILKIIDKHIKG